jgi:hypothetical protein
MITNGIPAYWKKNNNRKENSRKLICSALSLEIKLLIFRENSGICIQNINTECDYYKTHWFVRISRTIKESEYFNTKGKLKINKQAWSR